MKKKENDKMKISTTILFLLALSGCATHTSVNLLQIGMPLSEAKEMVQMKLLASAENCSQYRAEFRKPYKLWFCNGLLTEIEFDELEQKRRHQKNRAFWKGFAERERQRREAQNRAAETFNSRQRNDNYWQEQRARREYFQNRY